MRTTRERPNEKTRETRAGDEKAPSGPLRGWVRDRSLGIFFTSVFLGTWIGQVFFEWQVYAHDERARGAQPAFWSAGFWETFWQSTLENWQSEFLQLAAFTIAAAYFVFKGSAESPDSSERIESKLDALMEQLGVDPAEVESRLPLKHRKTR